MLSVLLAAGSAGAQRAPDSPSQPWQSTLSVPAPARSVPVVVPDPAKTYVIRPDLIRTDAWRHGFSLLERFDLSFDLQLYPAQMTDAAALALAYPNVLIILDHDVGSSRQLPQAALPTPNAFFVSVHRHSSVVKNDQDIRVSKCERRCVGHLSGVKLKIKR